MATRPGRIASTRRSTARAIAGGSASACGIPARSARLQTFFPMLAYADAPAAIEFLCRAFGFEERFRMDMPDGSVGHAELGIGDQVVMLASEWQAGGVGSPPGLQAAHAQARR